MPRVTSNNFQLVYKLTSHGHDVTNILPFPNERSMIAYAKRLHSANPITWNVVAFEKKDENGSWIRDDMAHSLYDNANQPVTKKTDVLMVHPLTHLSTLALSLSRVAAKRELNPQERQSLLEAIANVAQLTAPFDLQQLQDMVLETTVKAVQETTQSAAGQIVTGERQEWSTSLPVFETVSPVMDNTEHAEEQPKRKDKGLFSRK